MSEVKLLMSHYGEIMPISVCMHEHLMPEPLTNRCIRGRVNAHTVKQVQKVEGALKTERPYTVGEVRLSRGRC